MTFDLDADAAYLYLTDEISAGSASENLVVERKGQGDIVLDFDEPGRLLGIEIIGALELLGTAVLSRAEVVQ